MNIEKLAEEYALNTFLSEYEHTFSEIIAALYDNNILEGVLIWWPFESYPLNDLADSIYMSKLDFLEFHKRALKLESESENV